VKLATLKDGTPDGKLVVVSRDLKKAVAGEPIAPTLLAALENWDACEPRLQALSDQLNSGYQNAFDLNVHHLAAPLPRSPQWLDGSAFHSHGDLMSKVFGHEEIEGRLEIPLMYQGASDDFLGPCDDMPLPREQDGIDFEGEIAVVVDHVPMCTCAADALGHVKLLMLANDASLRALAPREMKTGFGFLQAKPSTSFSPVAVTLEELGDNWRDGRLHHRVHVELNGKTFGNPDAGEMGFGFHHLIEHGARSRNLSAGTIIGSGTISNHEFRKVGSACIAERRGIEALDHGKPATPYMKFGDRVRIEMFDAAGVSIFGAIDQRVVEFKRPWRF
jgi:fumarylacetoacetate (FAA) hydrolase